MEKYWNITEKGIVRSDCSAFEDNIEMSGKKISSVVYYGRNDDGKLKVSCRLFFPTLRKIPNNTHATLRADVSETEHISFLSDGVKISETPKQFSIDGVLSVMSDTDSGVALERTLFPARDEKCFIEKITVKNESCKSLSLSAEMFSKTEYFRGTKGVYTFEVRSYGEQSVSLAPGDVSEFYTVCSARVITEKAIIPDCEKELFQRRKFCEKIFADSLLLDTPDESINRLFNMSKLRIGESIFDTLKGPMNCPGGQAYYAAVWANDEAEYAAPYYGFAGSEDGYMATENMMELYRPFMGPDMHPIPASIIAEGLDIWEEAGDEGDASMYLYGVTRYLLEKGDKECAGKYFDTIDWCARYIASKENEEGVITSDCDELEARFKIGNANLLTNSLSYGGLKKAAILARELGYNEKGAEYEKSAEKLRTSIEKHFGQIFKGYQTYTYYKGCDIFRSYICAPLTVGIYDRAEGTADAVINNLLCENGFLTAEGDTMYWDRSTLYTFRGLFSAGLTDKAFDYFKSYSETRLTGSHVPYPVESWPEGHGRHLSAESGLYCRTVIEGLFGIDPAGFSSFTLKPSFPEEWNGKRCTLSKIYSFGKVFDIEVMKKGNTYGISVSYDGKEKAYNVTAGEAILIELD